jgi:hypothetical protein
MIIPYSGESNPSDLLDHPTLLQEYYKERTNHLHMVSTNHLHMVSTDPWFNLFGHQPNLEKIKTPTSTKDENSDDVN